MSRRLTAHKPTRTALRRELRTLARDFADAVVELLDEHGLWDEPPSSAESELARRVRRSADALRGVADRILGDLRARREPVAISTVAESLELDTRALAHPMHLLVTEGKVVQHGSRRGARYELARRRKPKKTTAKKRPAKKRRR